MFEVENCYGKKRKRKEKESRVMGREGYDEVLSGMASWGANIWAETWRK